MLHSGPEREPFGSLVLLSKLRAVEGIGAWVGWLERGLVRRPPWRPPWGLAPRIPAPNGKRWLSCEGFLGVWRS